MIKHVVMWKIKSENKTQKQEKIKKIRDMLYSLKERVSELESLEVGENFNSSGAAYDLVLITGHKNQEALEGYRIHPDHQQVAAGISELVSDRAVVDYEI